MQMEKVPPSKTVEAQLPPAEPPPSLENKKEETQWIQDTTTMATKLLRQEVLGKITVLSSSTYKKAHNIDPIDQEIQEFMLEKVIKQNTEKKKYSNRLNSVVSSPKDRKEHIKNKTK